MSDMNDAPNCSTGDESSLGSLTVDQLVQRLRSDDLSTAKDAVMDLARWARDHKSEEAFRILLDALENDPRPEIRFDVARLMHLPLRHKEFARRALDPLIQCLLDRHEDEDVREGCAISLSTLRYKRSIDALLEVVRNDPSDYLRMAVVWNMGGAVRWRPRLVDDLLPLIKHPSLNVRAATVWAIRESNDQRVAPAILRAMASDRSSWVREWAARCAKCLSYPRQEVIDALIARLSDRAAWVRLTAAWSLYQMKAAQGVDVLRQVLDDPKVPEGKMDGIRYELVVLERRHKRKD
jgi:HEAT repeat protein